MQGNRTWNVAQRATKPVESLEALRNLSAQQMLAEIREHRRRFADMAEIPSLPAEVRRLVVRVVQAADRAVEWVS
jgi:hypothetical protein